MSTYDATIRRMRSDLPSPKYRAWVDQTYPCMCDEAWTGRAMHATDCQWAVAIDVLDSLRIDGLLPGASRPDDNHTIDGTQDTSRLAALRARPNSGTQRAKILDFIERRGPYGATDEEIQASLGLSPNSERPRRVELVTGGWVVDSGARRLTESGNDSIVWISWTDAEEQT